MSASPATITSAETPTPAQNDAGGRRPLPLLDIPLLYLKLADRLPRPILLWPLLHPLHPCCCDQASPLFRLERAPTPPDPSPRKNQGDGGLTLPLLD